MTITDTIAAAFAAPPFLTRVRLRAQRRVLWMRAVWGAEPDPVRELAITDRDVDRILSRDDPAEAERRFFRDDARARELGEAIARADLIADDDGVFALLRRSFALPDEELDFLAMTLAVEADPMLRRVYGYLHDDALLGHATPLLGKSLFGWAVAPSFGPASPLVRWRLARPAEGAALWSEATPWMADPFTVALVLHGQLHDPLIAQAIEPATVLRNAPLLYPDTLDAAETFVRAMRNAGAPRIDVEFVAPSGWGKRTLAMQLAARLGHALVGFDGTALHAANDAALSSERALRAGRLARAAGALPYVGNAGELPPRAWDALHESADVVLCSGGVPAVTLTARKSITLPPLTHDARGALWTRLTSAPMPEEVGSWSFTPEEIIGVAAVAPAGPRELVIACRHVVHHAPGELLTPLATPYTWEDIVLSPSVRQHLQEFEDQARLRVHVLDDWGFARLQPLARGLSALFAGPSGTGKTMAAQVMARSVGLELYRVDLAGVVNKYIGETEKRLKAVFDTCERSDILLFFDEADALFGQRTQVKDAHDRFANIEIDYLLQRMEHFDGIAVLATNRRSDLDSAFVRRMRFIIEFMQPGPVERLALWRIALPERAPSGEPLLDGIDFALLAEKLAMTGASIKAAALSAAFLARAEGTPIGMRHVVASVRREMAKQGTELRPGDLGSMT